MDFIPTSLILNIFICLATAAFILYKLSIRNFDYWQQKGVPYLKPLPFVGNFLEVFTFRLTIGHFLAKLYNEFKTPYFGIYVLNKPHLVIRNPDLIKLILIKDFNYFYDRSVLSDEKLDPLVSKMLFFVNNPEWRALRTKMTPVFTTGKVKSMLRLITAAAEEMNTYLNENMSKNSIEAKAVCAKYSTNVIASCAFGINANSFHNENAQFRQVARKMFDFNWKTATSQTAYFMAPTLVKLFKLRFFDREATDFLREVFSTTMQEREISHQKRNDLIDIMIQMKKQSLPEDDIKFEGDLVVSQAAMFFAAGFESISTTMGFTLYELCIHPNIQNKLRSEIKTVLSQHGELTYEAIQDMKYLHMAVCEILRKYPVVPFLDRVCNEDYKVSNSDLVIEKGTPVFIPMFGLHYDPEYFPDPEKYDPERFSDENKANFPSCSYIPIGAGPRHCIGGRFGLFASKVGVAQILLEYELEASQETPIPLKYETKSFLLASTVGLPMKFKKIALDTAS